MLKKILKLVYVIPIYFILFIFQNARMIYNNISSNALWCSNVVYISKSMVIYILTILLSMTFLRKNYRRTSDSIVFVIFTMNLISGICPGRALDKFSLIYLYLLFMTYIVTYITDQKFEISIFITTSIILILSYILSLFNLLIIIKYLIFLSIFAGLIFLIYKNIKIRRKDEYSFKYEGYEHKEKVMTNFNTTTLVIFSFFFVVLVAGGINRYVSSYDEYSHWAFDAKSVITYNKLSTCSEVDSRTRDYPPMLSLWHYFVSNFTGFSEENLYIGISLFTLIFLMPAMSIVNKKNKILKYLLSLFLVFACYLLSGIYSYGSLYADLPFAMVFLNCFAIYQNFRKSPNLFKKLLSLNLIVLILTKPTGFVLASCFVLMLMVDDYINLDKENTVIEKIKAVVKANLFYILLILATIVIWYGYIKIMNVLVKDYYPYKLIPGLLSTSISAKLNFGVIAMLIKSLIQAFNENVINGFISLNLYQFILITFGMIYILYYFSCDKSIKKATKKMLPLVISYAAYFILIILAIFVMFSAYEAQSLASFVRYLDSYNLALVIYIVIYAFSDEFYIEKNKIISVIFLILLLLNIPYKSIAYVLYDNQDKITAKTFSTNMNKKFEIVRDNTKNSDRIYVLDQNDKDGIMAMWYARYYVFPRKTNASGKAINWKIRTDINSADLQNWGMTANDLAKNLYDYDFDYLYLYSFDDYMFDEMKNMFTDYDKAKKSTLFKVEKKSNETVKLIPVI